MRQCPFDWNLIVLKLWCFAVGWNCQITTYMEDFEIERKDRERLTAVCNQQKRDLEILQADRKSLLQQVSDHEHFSDMLELLLHQ